MERNGIRLVLAITCTWGFSFHVSADVFMYGDFIGTHVSFLDVTEDTGADPTANFGSPNILGDDLDFDPSGFAASSSNNSPQTTSSVLSLTIQSNADGIPISDLTVSDAAGDFTLSGLVAAIAEVSAEGSLQYVVNRVDGLPLDPPITGSMIMDITPSMPASLPGSSGTAVPWTSPPLHVDFTDVLLANNVIGHATSVALTMEFSVYAIAANGGSAIIALRDSQFPNMVVTIPEPGSAMLVGVAMWALAAWRMLVRRCDDDFLP